MSTSYQTLLDHIKGRAGVPHPHRGRIGKRGGSLPRNAPAPVKPVKPTAPPEARALLKEMAGFSDNWAQGRWRGVKNSPIDPKAEFFERADLQKAVGADTALDIWKYISEDKREDKHLQALSDALVKGGKPTLENAISYRGMAVSPEFVSSLHDSLLKGELPSLDLGRASSFTNAKEAAWMFAKPGGHRNDARDKVPVLLKIGVRKGTNALGIYLPYSVAAEHLLPRKIKVVKVEKYRTGYRVHGIIEPVQEDTKSLYEFIKGGKGSGNHGHHGIPGKRGGSSKNPAKVSHEDLKAAAYIYSSNFITGKEVAEESHVLITGGEPIYTGQEQEAAILVNAVRQGEIVPSNLYRGLSFDQEDTTNPLYQQLKKIKVGETITLDRLSSFTSERSLAAYYATIGSEAVKTHDFEFILQGSKAVYMDDLTGMAQGEYITHGKFEVTSVEGAGEERSHHGLPALYKKRIYMRQLNVF